MPRTIRQEAADQKERAVAPTVNGNGKKSKKPKKMDLSLRYDPSAEPVHLRHNLVVSLVGQWWRNGKAKNSEEDARSKGTTYLGAKNKTLEQLRHDLDDAIAIINKEKDCKLKILMDRHEDLGKELRGISGDSDDNSVTARKTKIATEKVSLLEAIDTVSGATEDHIKSLEMTHAAQLQERREKMKADKARGAQNALIAAEAKRRKTGVRLSTEEQKHSALTKISSEGLSSSSDSIARPEPQAAAVPAALVDVAPAGHAPQNSGMNAFEEL